jgi:hypothetical protein
VDLDRVADELYALPVDEFISTRTARVKEARAAKDRDLATAISALRKPSASAWVVNLLARERPDQVDQLSELATALRAAQETLSGPELRTLSSQRHRAIASIVTEARTLAAARGVRVSDSVARELEATFDAALADPSAADAVRSGRLGSALSYAGLGAAPAAAATPRTKAGATSAPRAEDRRQAERRQAETALHEAEAAESAADAALDAARTAQRQAVAAHDEAVERVADLTRQLEQAQAEVGERNGELRERKRALQRARHEAEEAQRTAERARTALG